MILDPERWQTYIRAAITAFVVSFIAAFIATTLVKHWRADPPQSVVESAVRMLLDYPELRELGIPVATNAMLMMRLARLEKPKPLSVSVVEQEPEDIRSLHEWMRTNRNKVFNVPVLTKDATGISPALLTNEWGTSADLRTTGDTKP